MEEFFDIALDVCLDAFKDTLYLVPFLFLTYLVMEWLEHKASASSERLIARAGFMGPFVGSLLGVIPQCGFSSAASTFYAGRVITLGTLIAVYLSTSDEMLPIFIANGVAAEVIIKILLTKVIIGIVFGVLIDLGMRAIGHPQQRLRIHEICEREGCNCNGDCKTCKEHPERAYGFENDTEHHHDHSGTSLLKSALGHTINVTIFVFLISLALNVVFAFMGGDAFRDIVAGNPVLSIFASALFGLIPNCAASVAIAELYVQGVLGSAAMMSGLLVSAGVGLLVLFRANRPVLRSVIIVAILYVVGVICGLLIYGIGLNF